MTQRKTHTRNRKSRIKLLPRAIKSELDKLLREDRMTQADMLKQINALCEKHGEEKVSQSSLSRYQKHMDEMGQQIRELREVSDVWVSKLGEAPTSNVGKMLLEAVRTLAADVIIQMRKDKGNVEPKALNQLALVMQRVEQAALTSHKREKEIRQAFAEEVADHIEEKALQRGMNKEDARYWRGEVLGVSQ